MLAAWGCIMVRLLIRLTIATIFLAWPGTHSIADEASTYSDANLITALDVSGSIMRHEEWLQVEGLAKAVVSAAVLDAIAGGRHGRIGFAVHTWSSGGRFDMIVPWTLIESVEDAEEVARALRGFAIDRSSWQDYRNGSGGSDKFPEHQTDISGAIDFAASLALAAPHVASRTVVNLCANGTDNVAQDPRAARDRAMAAGIVINGLVIAGKQDLAGYFRDHVQGGAGSFVMEVMQPSTLAQAMVEKLLRDLIAGRPPVTAAVPFT
jgi:Protein of unknown function (DUF1194)